VKDFLRTRLDGAVARTVAEVETMGKVAFVFPGQASQYPGMGKELAEKYPAARAVFDERTKRWAFPFRRCALKAPKKI